MESVTEGCDTKTLNLTMSLAGIDAELVTPKCYHTSHHKTMKWNTKAGRQEEGLTMMSTLLCIRGGIITFKVSGQIYLDAPTEALSDQTELTISMEYFKFLLKYENAGDSWKFAQDLGDGVITIAFGVVLKTRKGGYPLGKEAYEKYMDMAARNIPITVQEAYQLTRTHLDNYINTVKNKAQQEGWNLTQNRFDAIVDMVWNLGDGAIRFNATELIATGDLNDPDVKKHLMKEILETAHFEQTNGEGVWSKNLVERRLDVVKIAEEGDDAYTKTELSGEWWNQNARDFLLENGIAEEIIDKYEIQKVQ